MNTALPSSSYKRIAAGAEVKTTKMTRYAQLVTSGTPLKQSVAVGAPQRDICKHVLAGY